MPTIPRLAGCGLMPPTPPGTPGTLSLMAPAPPPSYSGLVHAGSTDSFLGVFILFAEVCFELLITVRAPVWAPAKESFSVFLGSSLNHPACDMTCSVVSIFMKYNRPPLNPSGKQLNLEKCS